MMFVGQEHSASIYASRMEGETRQLLETMRPPVSHQYCA
jgi:hypothetical protein